MRRTRVIPMLLAALMLCGALPARAAAVPVMKILGTDGAVTAAVRTTGQTRELVYTTDGTNWQPCTVEGDGSRVGEITYGGWETGPQLDSNWGVPAWADGLAEGAGMFYATSYAAALTNRTLYVSDDGIRWYVPEEDEAGFVSTAHRALCSCGGYDFKLEDNRLYYTGGMVVSELPAVSAEAARRGLDYADVRAYPVGEAYITIVVYDRWDADGRSSLTMTYTRDSLDWVQGAAWDQWTGAENVVNVTSNGDVMLAKNRDRSAAFWGVTYCYSYDGRVWRPVRMPALGSWVDGGVEPYNGRSFVILDGGTGELFYAEDPAEFRQVPVSERFPTMNGLAQYTFLWTGGAYIACQNVTQVAMMMGVEPDYEDPYRTSVSFFDEQFREISRHDLGEQVWSVSCVDGVYYALTKEIESMWDLTGPGPEQPYTIWSSTNQTDWVKTGLTELPQALPEGVKALGAGDVWAAPYVFRLAGADLLVSRDGVDFVRLGGAPAAGEGPAGAISAAVGREGVLILGLDGDGQTTGSFRNFTREAVEAALNGEAVEQ